MSGQIVFRLCNALKVTVQLLHQTPRPRGSLYAQRHDGVYDVVVVLLEGLDGLLPGDTSLLHDKLNVLALETGVINLLVIVLLLFLLLVLDGLALGGLVTVVVASVVVGLGLGLSKLLGGGGLGLGVEVLDLGLTEDAGAGSVGGKAMEGQQTNIQVLLEGDLYTSGWLMTKRICHVCQPNSSRVVVPASRRGLVFVDGGFPLAIVRQALTFLGRRRVTRVMPSMCFSPSLAMALRAFFSLREWTATEEPAGTFTSPSSFSDSSLDSSSSICTFFFSGSSAISSMRGLAILSVCVVDCLVLGGLYASGLVKAILRYRLGFSETICGQIRAKFPIHFQHVGGITFTENLISKRVSNWQF